MKSILKKIGLIFLAITCQCNPLKSQHAEPVIRTITANFRNNALPHQPDTLKILGIGNSFTEDGMYYLPDLLENAGIKNVILGKLVIGGCSLEKHDQLYQSGDTAYHYQKSYPENNAWADIKGRKSFKDAVSDENWDIIVIQQVSGHSGMYETYQPYLNHLIDAMVINCPNAGVRIAWQMTWAYGQHSDHKSFANYNQDQLTMYNAILRTVDTMIGETGIDLIIPSGTAIQNIRHSGLDKSSLDMTRDGYHIDLGAGRYTLACTWFQALIAPCFGITIAGNTYRTSKGNIPVDEENYMLCQKAAQYACCRRFEISVIAQN